MHVEPERHRVAPVPKEGEPLGVADDHVELVAMHDEIAPAVRADVNRLALDGDAAELRAAIIPHGLVVVAGNVNELGALAHFAQEFLQHVVMGLRPVDAAPDAPEVDDVTDQVDLWSVVEAQEVEKRFGLASLGPEMNIGNKERPELPCLGVVRRVIFGQSVQHDTMRVKVILYQVCDIGEGLWLTRRAEVLARLDRAKRSLFLPCEGVAIAPAPTRSSRPEAGSA